MFFIFDWDGTISDSTTKICRCMQAASQDVGLECLERGTIQNIIGLGLPEALRSLYPNITNLQLEQMREAYAKHFKEADQVPSPFFPDVMHTLNILAEQNYKLAVATGKSRRGLDRVLASLGLSDFFHFSRCADETASKPHPLMLHELLAEAEVSLGQAVMIGDTEWDMVMADNCGMKKIAVTYGAHSPERLKVFEPDLFVDDFKDILNWRFD
ncbi:HAD-IA family hydrolase [Agaribacterium sp. ZY112]|uniref:HAD-IA family hydrolase n=1 Tax=Agaribacterium sp. ZY112 TaxID=3233574 RepID=UPI003525B4C8